MDVCRVLVRVLVDCGPLVDICRSNTRTGVFSPCSPRCDIFGVWSVDWRVLRSIDWLIEAYCEFHQTRSWRKMVFFISSGWREKRVERKNFTPQSFVYTNICIINHFKLKILWVHNLSIGKFVIGCQPAKFGQFSSRSSKQCATGLALSFSLIKREGGSNEKCTHILYTVQCTLHTEQCTLHTACCILHTAHCTL